MHAVNESLQQIDADHWSIANKLVLSHSHPHQRSPSSGQISWGDGKGGFYILSDATQPLSQSPRQLCGQLCETSEIRKVYDAGTSSAVWRVGEAFIKVKKVLVPMATREHVTLGYLDKKKSSLGFNIPTVIYHTEFEGRYYIVLSRLTGQTLGEAWPNMGESTKQDYVSRIATICHHLTSWESDRISGVDGRYLSELYLSRHETEESCKPQSLLEACQESGMDCSTLVFYHCDLGPGNIIIDPEGLVGIIDWETAGYVPREWIRTKFCLSSGMDLEIGDEGARREWRKRVAQRLGDMGFSEVVEMWASWFKS